LNKEDVMGQVTEWTREYDEIMSRREIRCDVRCEYPVPQDLLDEAHKWGPTVGFDREFAEIDWSRRKGATHGSVDHAYLCMFSMHMWNRIIGSGWPQEWPQDLMLFYDRLDEYEKIGHFMFQ
jgi:hypothetical protein